MSSYPVAALVGVACVAGIIGEAAAQAPLASLTREDAIARALDDDPGVDAADSARLAAEAGARQTGRWANPTLDILQENVSGSGPYRGSDRGETTYSFRQPLQLGGDRSARRRLAESELDTARVGAGVRRADLIEEVEHAFIDAQAAEAALAVAEERLTVARELAAAVGRPCARRAIRSWPGLAPKRDLPRPRSMQKPRATQQSRRARGSRPIGAAMAISH